MQSDHRKLLEEKMRSNCLCCILLSLLLVGLCIVIAASNHPSVKYDVLAGRPRNMPTSYTLDTPDFTLVSVMQHMPQHRHTEVAWRHNTVVYTYWHQSEVLVLQSGPLKGNCYRMPHVKEVYDGPLLVRRATATVRSQPTAAYMPETLRTFQGDCNQPVMPIVDLADSKPLTAPDQMPWGSSFDLSSSTHITALRAEMDRVTPVSLQEQSLEIYRTELQSLWFNASDSTIQRSAEPHNWPLTGGLRVVHWSCARLRDHVTPSIFGLCLDLMRCHETRVIVPPQGPVNTSAQCRFSHTDYDCGCISDFVGATTSSALNGCGLCTANNPESCRCWAQARFLSLVARLTPCVQITELGSHTLYSGIPKVHSHCGEKPIRWGTMGVHRTSTSLRLCSNELRGPVYTCYSMAENHVRNRLPQSQL